tara:strand:+ start:382 stop:636 length:255 start_codon:yes stop_codon:yes gene_type:complete
MLGHRIAGCRECVDFFQGKITLALSEQEKHFAQKRKDKLSNHPTFSYIAATELYVSSFSRKQRRDFLKKGREIRENLMQSYTSS